jgi:tetratricopeptide (TPR) repeat protein
MKFVYLMLLIFLTVLYSISNCYCQTAEEYVEMAKTKIKMEDYNGAIAACDLAITINPEYSHAYLQRGIAKSAKEKKRDAILDYDIAIKLNPLSDTAYIQRGNTKWRLLDQQGALADYNKTIQINPRYAFAYIQRGLLKISLGLKDEGCLEIHRAGELGLLEFSREHLRTFCK